jgi:hypothetical protein
MTLLEISHQPRRRRRRRPSPRNDTARICWLMEAAVAAAFAVPVNDLRAPLRCTAEVAFARQSAMYLAHVALGLPCNTVGRVFHRDRTTAAHACQLVEQRRDDPATDRLLDMLEGVCAELARSILTRPQVRPGVARIASRQNTFRILRSRKLTRFAASILPWRSARSRPNMAPPASSSMTERVRSPGSPAGAAATAAAISNRISCRRASDCAPISHAPI